MDSKWLAKPQCTVDGWMAEEKFQIAASERLNSWRKFSNSWQWMAEQLEKSFDWRAVIGWTAEDNFRTACGEQQNSYCLFWIIFILNGQSETQTNIATTKHGQVTGVGWFSDGPRSLATTPPLRSVIASNLGPSDNQATVQCRCSVDHSSYSLQKRRIFFHAYSVIIFSKLWVEKKKINLSIY